MDERLYLRLVGVFNEIAQVSVAKPQKAIDVLIRQLCSLVGAESGGVVLAARDPHLPTNVRDQDPLWGWRPQKVIEDSRMEDWRRKVSKEWTAHQPNVLANPGVKKIVSEAGRHRAHLRRRIVSEETFERSPTAELWRNMKIADRIGGAHAFSSSLELHVLITRYDNSPRFDEEDRQVIEWAIAGLGHFCGQLGRVFGLVDTSEPLTPRERSILVHLLAGRSTAECARRLGLRPGSVRQRVLDIYRKFGVSSRPELMALWQT